MPVVRNPQFYFREGFCWTNILNPDARLLKTKLKNKSVNDVGSMSLYSQYKITPDFYVVSLLNSEFLFDYYRVFINCTVNIQINDIRQMPIIIPNSNQLCNFKNLFDKAYVIKIMQFENKISEIEAEKQIKILQIQLENLVEDLYQINR